MSEVNFCTRCGAPRRGGTAFCTNCGLPLPEAGTTGLQEPQVVSSPAPVVSPPPAAAPPPSPAVSPPPGSVSPQPVAPAPSPASTVGTPGRASRRAVHALALIGGAVAAVAAFLPWLSSLGSANAFDVPLAVLWSLDPGTGGLKLGFALVPLGAVGVLLAFVPGLGAARRLVGVLLAAAAVDFVVQTWRAVSDLGGGVGDVFDLLGVGAYVTLVGGALIASGK